ncbi:hypothetical protein QBC32DRAFT_319506, partial [Pseudoneurospora amorphoporcata]
MRFLPTVTALIDVALIGVVLTGAAPTGVAPTGAAPPGAAPPGLSTTTGNGVTSSSTTNASCGVGVCLTLLIILGIISGPCSCAPTCTGLPTTGQGTQHELDWSKYIKKLSTDHTSSTEASNLRHNTATSVVTARNDGKSSPTTGTSTTTGLPTSTAQHEAQLDWSKYIKNLSSACVANTEQNDGTPSSTTTTNAGVGGCDCPLAVVQFDGAVVGIVVMAQCPCGAPCASTGLPTSTAQAQLDWSKYIKNLSDYTEAYSRYTACVANTGKNDGTTSSTTSTNGC